MDSDDELETNTFVGPRKKAQYNSLVRKLLKQGNKKKALAVARKMFKQCIEPDRETFDALTRARLENGLGSLAMLCVVGLVTEAERLFDIRRNRLNSLKENEKSEYTNLEKIKIELEESKKIFKKNKWPTIDVTRKSVEETAASIIKIFEIKNK